MDRNSSARIIKSASAFLAVLIIIAAIVLINQKRAIEEKKEKELRENIEYNSDYDERLDKFSKYADGRLADRNTKVEKRNSDYVKYSLEEYKLAHFSMWDVSALPGDDYSLIFGSDILYSDYEFETPMELKEYLENIVSSENSISTVYINVDPYLLEENYHKATYYDEGAVPFEEYIYSQIFPILDTNQNVLFQFILPSRPVSYWASLPYETYDSIIDKWYSFLMYLHWCPNAVATFMGDVEWLVANDMNYQSAYRFNDDVMQKIYIYLYAFEEYRLNAPELKERKGAIDKYIRRRLNGDYNVADLSGRKIIFMGDSLFDCMAIDSQSIPAWVSYMTGAECYNFAIGGTKASEIDTNGFTKVAVATAMKSVLECGNRYTREAKRFFEKYDENDDLTFVILYGMNDYFSNIPIGKAYIDDDVLADIEEQEEDYRPGYKVSETFVMSLEKGVEALKTAYPTANIIMLAPYQIGRYDGGKEPAAEGGQNLEAYVKAIEAVARYEGVLYYDMYNDGLFVAENEAYYLTDGVHTRERGAFLLAEDLAKKIDSLTKAE